MKNLIPAICILLATTACSLLKNQSDESLKTKPVDFVVDADTIQLIGLLDANSSSKELETITQADSSKPLKIYIQGAFGDIAFLEKLLAAMKGKNTTCFARQAAGPFFTLVQACKTRLVGEQTYFLARRITATLVNVSADEVEKYSSEIKGYEERLTGLEADHLGLSLADYVVKATKEGWSMKGASAIFDANAADGLARVVCPDADSDFTKTFTLVTPDAPPGATVPVRMTICPMPRKVFEPAKVPAQAFTFFGLLVDEAPNGNAATPEEL